MAIIDGVSVSGTVYGLRDNDTSGGIAATFSTSTAYTPGQYVWYDSGSGAKLYRFTADHAAGAWTGTDATEVKIGPEMDTLRNSLNGPMSVVNMFDKTTVTTGKYLTSRGALQSASATDVSAQIIVRPGKKVKLSHHLNSTTRYNIFQNKNGSLVDGGAFPCNAENQIMTVPSDAKYLRCTVGKDVLDDFYVVEVNAIENFINDITYNIEPEVDANTLAIQNIIDKTGLETDITDQFTFTDGKVVNSSIGQLVTSTVGSYSNYVAIPDGYDKLKLMMVVSNDSYARGMAFYTAIDQTTYISGVKTRSDTSLSVWSAEMVEIPIPQNAKYFRTTWMATDYEPYGSYTFSCSLIKTGTIGQMGEEIDQIEDTLNTIDNPFYRHAIKLTTETIDGFSHCAFPSSALFGGKEIIAYRASMSHYTPQDTNKWGGIMLDTRSDDGTWQHIGLLDTSSVTFSGELRDPKLTVSRDGHTLFVSAFTTYRAEGTSSPDLHDNVIFTLNDALEVTGGYVASNVDYLAWGNVLETPNGHLLYCAYGDDKVVLYHSTAAYSGTIAEIAFDSPIILSSSSAQEPTIGYFNNLLVCLYRRNNYYSHITYTENLEGDSGWAGDQSPTGDLIIHAPVLLPYFKGNMLPFAGALYLSSNLRRPIIGVLKNNSGTFAYAGWGYVDTSFDGYSGYSGMSYLGGDLFSDTYYQESTASLSTIGASTGVYYKQLHLRMYCPSMAYESLA